MDPRRWLVLGAVVGLGLLSAALFWPRSKEERLREATLELFASVEVSEPPPSLVPFVAHLNQSFERLLAERVHVAVADVPSELPETPRELAVGIAPLLLAQGSFHVSARSLEVRLEPSAQVLARVEVELGSGAEADAAASRFGQRTLHLSFDEIDGDFRLRELIVDAP